MCKRVKYTETEKAYIAEVREIGSTKGDCEELRDLYRKAYDAYKSKTISSAAYNRIYSICMEHANPR